MDLSQGGPLAIVDMAGTKEFFQTVFDLLLWYFCHDVTSGEIAALNDSGQVMISHPGDDFSPVLLGIE